MCGDVGNGFSQVIEPFGAFAQMERPGQTIIGYFPAFCQTRDQFTVLIVFNQSIDDVGSHGLFIGGTFDEIIHRGDFTAVQRTVNHGFAVAQCIGFFGYRFFLITFVRCFDRCRVFLGGGG